jgi:phosphoadenosine phosphosulfate reductase
MQHQLQNVLFDDHSALEWKSMDLLKDNCPSDGYYVAFSGGKDSTVILDLVKRSGCKFDAHYNVTTVDPPELVRFIRNQHPEVVFERPVKTMWQLIEENMMPPMRQMRYCCRWLKERTVSGDRVIVIGVRAEESQRRSLSTEIRTNDRHQKCVSPIFAWSSTDVWQHIRLHHLPYCELYDKGWERIGCPFNSKRVEQLAKYPGIAHAYRNACRKAFDRRIERGKTSRWKDGDEMYSWWIGETLLLKPEDFTDNGLFLPEGVVDYGPET